MVAPGDGDRSEAGPTLRIEEGFRGFGGQCLYAIENRQKMVSMLA